MNLRLGRATASITPAIVAGLAGLAGLVLAQSAAAQTRDDDDDEAQPPAAEVVVTARRLDEARAKVEPSLGASTYSVSNDVVEARPGGESANLIHVLLQMPGVLQSPSGELSVRAQTGLQYRINNVIVPDGFTDLADTIRARFADKVQLVTGALPAQYGLQVGGVVNITTKNGAYEHGGEVEAYGGSHGHAETAFEAAGSTGNTNLYASASYLHDRAGLGSVDGAAAPLHDTTDQADAFAFVDHIIDPQSRLSVVAGLSSDWNEFPNPRGPGASLDRAQRNQSAYGLVSYQRTAERLTYQVSGSVRYSTLRVSPDAAGELRLKGVSQAVDNHASSAGLQIEGVYELASAHKLRAGGVITVGRDASRAAYLAFPVASDGRPASAVPLALGATSVEHRTESSLFLQDEWRPVAALTVNFGLRYDDVSGEGGGRQVSPRLNAVWEPIAGTTLHAGYARYFIPAPQTEQAGWPRLLAGTTGAAPGPSSRALRAESDNYVDLGVEQRFEDLTLGVDAYWREATDLIDAVRVGSTSLTRPFNFADGRIRGVEINATYADGPVTAWANLAIAHAEGRVIVSGEASFTPAELAAAAGRFTSTNSDQRVTASLGSSYHWRAWRLSADAIYGSGLPRTPEGGLANSGHLPDYVAVNLSAVYRLDGLRDRPLDLRLDVSNAFDAKYRLSDGTSLAGGDPLWGARRGVLVGLEQQF